MFVSFRFRFHYTVYSYVVYCYFLDWAVATLNARSAELDFMLDLETLFKETTADPELIELNCCLEDNNTNMIPNEYRTVAKKLTHRWGIIMVDDRIVMPKSLRYAALNALHFGHPGINNVCSDAMIFWWPNMQEDIEKKSKTCSACLNAGKNLKFQIPQTEKKQKSNHPNFRPKNFNWISPSTYTIKNYLPHRIF